VWPIDRVVLHRVQHLKRRHDLAAGETRIWKLLSVISATLGEILGAAE
jgi:hypothetical protein